MLADIYRQRDSPIVQAILGYIYYIYIANLSYEFWYTINLFSIQDIFGNDNFQQ